MLEPEAEAIVESGLRKVWLIWTAMLFSQFIFIVICNKFEPLQGAAQPGSPVDPIIYLVYFLSAAALVAAYFLRKLGLSGRSAQTSAEISTHGGQALVARYTGAVILSLSMIESIGAYGLVLFMCFGDSFSMYTLIAIAGASMLYFRPNRDELEQFALRLNQGSTGV